MSAREKRRLRLKRVPTEHDELGYLLDTDLAVPKVKEARLACQHCGAGERSLFVNPRIEDGQALCLYCFSTFLAAEQTRRPSLWQRFRRLLGLS